MNIKNLLAKKGPLTTSYIKKLLTEVGISDDAARKRISRATSGILRFNKLKLPKNIQLLYLPSHSNSPLLRRALIDALAETDSIHFHALQALKAFGSRTTMNNFLVLSGCPTKRKKKKNVEILIKELEQSQLIYQFLEGDIQWYGEVQSADFLSSESITNPSIIHTLQELLFNPIEDWLRKNSLVSFNKTERFGNFAGYYWHLTAPSYLLPLVKKDNSSIKPGFLVMDILPQNDIQVSQIKYFISKCNGCSFQKNVMSFLPVLIGNGFSTSALKLAKENNIFITTPRNLFGDDVANAIDCLIRILSDAAKFLQSADEKAVFDIINKIAKIEGKANNVRGQLFELVSGHIVLNSGYSFIEVGKKVQDSQGQLAEIDVFAKKNLSEIKIVECKGFSSKSPINIEDIKKWFGRIKIIRSWAKNHPDHSTAHLHFEYWASSGFSAEAQAFLSSKQSDIRKFTINWLSGKEVIKLAHDLKLTSMVNLLREHYVKDAFY